jgi:Arc/MetJ-type ribon-helix-helix transcriptional regulator
MKLISLNITEKQEEWIQLLIDLKYYPNRSECIRNFINLGIKYMADLMSKKPMRERLK